MAAGAIRRTDGRPRGALDKCRGDHRRSDACARAAQPAQPGHLTGREIASTRPRASSASTATNRAEAGALRTVWKPVLATLRRGANVFAEAPAARRQRATSLAPFQLT
jgi:hypothetical protein